MTTYHLGGTDLQEQTDWADDDRLLTLDSSEHTAAPSDSNGGNKFMQFATAAKAFYKGAYLVLPSSGNVAATNATLINSAITAAVSAGIGVVKWAPVAWNVACGTISHDGSGLTQDMAGVTVTASGSGDLIRLTDSSTYDDRTTQGGGITGFPVLDGSSTSGNACAVHAGDILELALFFQAQNWTAGTTSKGLWLDNQNFWTEQAYGRVYLQNCTAHGVFDVSGTPAETATGSFDRAALKIFVNQGAANQDGVVFQHGTYIDDITNLHIGGNFQTSSTTPTSAVLRITDVAGGSRPDAGVASHLGNGKLSINAECGIVTGTQGPFTIVFGAAGNYISNPVGSMSFDAAGVNFQPSNNDGGQFKFLGSVTGDNNLAGTFAGNVQTGLVQVFGSSGSLGPYTDTGDGNNLPVTTLPSGLALYRQLSQAAATSPVTVGNTTTITSLGSMSVDAGDPVAGARYKVTAHGLLSTEATPGVMTLDLRWGGTGGTLITSLVTSTSAPAAPASLTAVPVLIEGEVEFITSTTCVAWLRLTYRPAATTASVVWLNSITTAVTVTTSSTELLSLDWKWATANASNTITIASSNFERVS